jgi:hypothetical protein
MLIPAWLAPQTRGRRVLLLLVVVWILSMCDLVFTLQESRASYFIEMNPVAALVLNGPPIGVVLYKFILLGLGSTILGALRVHRTAEAAAWFLIAASGYVMYRWVAYFDGVTKITPLACEFTP